MTLAQLKEWHAALPGFLRRQAKTAGQAEYGWSHPKQVSFVFGCQRSGTKMLMRILENSPATRIYHENHATAFNDFQLRSDAVLRALIALNPAPAQIFKPICDSHRADDLLAAFPESHGVWVYRHFDDVANSALEKWGEHQRGVVAAVAAGDLETWGWRTARLPPHIVSEIQRVYRPDLTNAEGALLFWYLRNAFFFELGLDRQPRMKLVRYEPLVTHPEAAFAEVFAWIGAPFHPTFLERVHAGSVGKKSPPQASPEIRSLCADLMAKLDAWTPPPPIVVSPVLLLINTLGVGGAERYVVTVANWLADHGSEVTVVAMAGALRGELRPTVQYHPMDLLRVRHDLPAAAAGVRQVINRRRPAVMVANSLACTWVARAADPIGRIPVVNIAHGWPVAKYASVGPLMAVADAVVAVSPEVKARLVAAGVPASRCEVVFNGVDTAGLGVRRDGARSTARTALGARVGAAGDEDVLVVTVGRLHPQKAQHHVITLAARLREAVPNLRFAIIGEGEREAELAGLIEAQGVGDRVRMLGLRADVPELLGAADICLGCSDWEGMSLTTIEAMASGLAIVATRTEGASHLLDSNSGVLVPIGDVDAMEAGIRALAANPARRKMLGDAARARAITKFSHERMCSELNGILDRVARTGS